MLPAFLAAASKQAPRSVNYLFLTSLQRGHNGRVLRSYASRTVWYGASKFMLPQSIPPLVWLLLELNAYSAEDYFSGALSWMKYL